MNTNKDKIQKEALKAWVNGGRVGAIEMVTGSGKSRIGVLAAKEAVKEGKVLVITPTEILRDEEWVNEFKKWGVSTDNVEFECINSAWKKSYGEEYKLLLVDEADACISRELKGKFIKLYTNPKNIFSSKLLLSAKFDEKAQKVLEEINTPIVYNLDYSQAIKEGLITDFSIWNIGIQMSQASQAAYSVIQEELRYYNEYFTTYYDLENRYIYNYVLKILNSKDYNHPEWDNALAYINLISNRTKIIHKDTNKLKYLESIVKGKNLNKKIIVFSERKSESKDIVKLLDERSRRCYQYSSDDNNKKRAKTMKLFKRSKRGIISAVNCLNRGINVPDCGFLVIYSGNGSEIDFIQRLGRGVRISQDQNKKAVMVQLYYKDTQDYWWTRRRTGGLPVRWIDEKDVKIK